MKLIIAGSRRLPMNIGVVEACMILSNYDPTEIVSGHSGTVDLAGEAWAKVSYLPVTLFVADWDKYKRAAGPIRNAEMAEYADALLLIWDGKSKGSLNMKLTMEKLNKPVYEVIRDEP